MSRSTATALAALAVLLAGAPGARAADPQQQAAKFASSADTRGAVPPAARPAPPPGPEYRIGAGDVLAFSVWKEPDASVPSITVRPDGKLSLPMIGEIAAAGMTPAELERLATQKYGELIRGARVTVMVVTINSQKAYVLGEVKKEGPIPLATPVTVLQALAEAGGVTDFAKRRRIYILRMVDNRRIVLPFDYEAVVRGRNMEQNVLLAPGDTVVVPR